MRIHARPAIISFQTGQPTQYLVSVVGMAPHKTWFTEQHLGLTPDPHGGPALVGEFIQQELHELAVQEIVQKHGPATAQNMLMQGQIKFSLPDIPGVTTPGTWKNPRFGNPERHRQLYGLMNRSPEREREIIGEPERFHA